MGGPKQMLWNIFCALVWPSRLEHHPASKENVVVFLQFLIMQNSVIMFTFSDFDRKYHSWVNLVQKSKIVSLF